MDFNQGGTDMAKDMYIGVDLGGTKLLVGLFDNALSLKTSQKVRTPGTSNGDEIRDLIISMIERTLAEAQVDASRLAGITVAVPGPINFKEGIVLDTPNIGFKDYPLRKYLLQVFKCAIALENDVNAGIYGEFKQGIAMGYQNIVGVYPGSGIGGGWILDGRLYRGANGSAGEVGHMRVQDGGRLCGCGRYGCLESVASKNALARDLVALAATGKAPSIFQSAGTDFSKIRSGVIKKSIKAGETAVLELVQRMAHFLGIGLANCVNIFDPEVVVLGGGMIEKLGEEILPIAEQSMRDHAQAHMVKSVKLLVATLGDDSVITGCAHLAKEAFEAAGSPS
jgi:glucokinase